MGFHGQAGLGFVGGPSRSDEDFGGSDGGDSFEGPGGSVGGGSDEGSVGGFEILQLFLSRLGCHS